MKHNWDIGKPIDYKVPNDDTMRGILACSPLTSYERKLVDGEHVYKNSSKICMLGNNHR